MAKIRKTDRQSNSLTALLAGLCLLIMLPLVHAEIAPEAASARYAVKTAQSSSWMAVTANPYASDAAAQILAQDGSAVDAAIAAQLVLGLTEPQSSGIGGGAFLLFWDKSSNTLSHFDGRETAPREINPNHFLQNGKSMPFFEAVVGGHAVGTPGVLQMLDLAHQQYGILPWRDLFQPAIQLATNGFIVSERLQRLLEQAASHPATMQQQAFVDYFYPNGKAVTQGTLLKNLAYAKTLQLIAEDGAKVFYQGIIADHIVDAVQQNNVRQGLLNKNDLADYRAIRNDAVCTLIKQYRLCGSPPPSAGPIAIMQIALMMNELPNAKKVNPLSADFYHRFSEALKLAMADRNVYIADPLFIPIPIEDLLNPHYLKQRASLIPLKKASSGITPHGAFNRSLSLIGGIETEQPSTTHLSIVDANGNWLSMTSSIEMAFGSRIMVDGFLLNNQLTDFSFTPRDQQGWVANRVEANKRPRSSMSPILVFDQQDLPILAIGSPGGSRIISYVAKTFVQSLLLGMPMDEAIDSPHISVFANHIELEKHSLSNGLYQSLTAKGHAVKWVDQTSGLHIIQRHKTHLQGFADSRREGTVVTFTETQ